MNAYLDQQLRRNDCGISAVKTICNILNVNIGRDVIEDAIPLDETGSSFGTLKKFFEEYGFETKVKLLDVNSINDNEASLKALLPCITPVKSSSGLHYLVINGIQNGKLVILDPSEARSYKLTIQEFKKRAYFSSSYLQYADLEDVLKIKVNEEFKKYGIVANKIFTRQELINLVNKLTYFSYIQSNFDFKDNETRKRFLHDLLFNQELNQVPDHFESLNYYENGKVKIKAPILLSISKTEQTRIAPSEDNVNVYWKLYKSISHIQSFWYIYLFASILVSIISYVSVFIFQVLIDHILPSYELGTLQLFAVGLGFFYIIDLLFYSYRKFVSIHLSNALDKYFLSIFDEKLNKFSIRYLQSFRRGDLTERLSDSLKLKSFFKSYFSSILVNLMVALLSMSILIMINWRLSMLVSGVLVFFIGMFFFFTPIIERLERQRFSAKADFFSKFIEKIDGIQVVKAMGLEHYSTTKLRGSIDEMIRIQTKSRYVGLANSVTSSLVVSFSILAIILFTSREMILYNTLSLGMILTFITLSSKIFSAFGSLLDKNLSLQEHKVILNRFFDFEEKKTAIQTIPENGKIKDFSFEKFSLTDVSFSYDEENMLLKNINLEVNRGDKIWIQGKNGTGKSTLCKIMGFLYTPAQGELLLNGLTTSMYNKKRVRKSIVLISSDDMIFNESLLFNISFGRKIDMAKLVEFAKVLNFYSFVEKQPDRFHCMLHENGRNLSTGQRRKVLLLRALMLESEVIILDEIFNGIDSETQRRAQIVIDMIEDRTFVIISHIPLPNINFNKEYGLEDGQLIEKTT